MKHVLIHGLGQNATSYKQVATMIEDKENIDCIDLNALLKGKMATYQNLSNAFMQHCNNYNNKIDLCGLSLGGILALQYAIENPDKVNSLILIGTQYVMPKTLLKIQNILFHFMPKKMFSQLGFQKHDFIQLSKSMMNLDFSNKLSNLTMPVLIICGEKDKANKTASIALSNNITNAKLMIIKNANHEINIEQPEQLGKIIDTFFKQNKPVS